MESDDSQFHARLIIEPLDPRKHVRAAFDSGNAKINNFLHSLARQQSDVDIAKTYVLIDPSRPSTIIGYYALSAHAIDASALPKADLNRLPGYQRLPAILLGWFGVDLSVQRRGVGRHLMGNVLHRCVDVSNRIGARFLVIDAIDDDAARFYERLSFTSMSDDPRRFITAIDVIRKAIARA